MELNRRAFITAVTAAAIVPLPKEAPHHLLVEVLRDDTWTIEPNGLRCVRRGERFRTSTPDTDLLVVDATADEDGYTGVDSDGLQCGEVLCTIAEYGPGAAYGAFREEEG